MIVVAPEHELGEARRTARDRDRLRGPRGLMRRARLQARPAELGHRDRHTDDPRERRHVEQVDPRQGERVESGADTAGYGLMPNASMGTPSLRSRAAQRAGSLPLSRYFPRLPAITSAPGLAAFTAAYDRARHRLVGLDRVRVRVPLEVGLVPVQEHLHLRVALRDRIGEIAEIVRVRRPDGGIARAGCPGGGAPERDPDLKPGGAVARHVAIRLRPVVRGVGRVSRVGGSPARHVRPGHVRPCGAESDAARGRRAGGERALCRVIGDRERHRVRDRRGVDGACQGRRTRT